MAAATAAVTAGQYRRYPILTQETKSVFEKLYKFIGKDIKSMIERPDGRYCLRLHKNKIYYVSEALMKKATNVSQYVMLAAA